MASSGTILPSPGQGGGPDTGAGAEQQGPGPAGSPISPQPAMPDPNAAVLGWIRDIIANSRRIGQKFPAAADNMRNIQNEVQRAQQKIVQSNPAPEPMAPPV